MAGGRGREGGLRDSKNEELGRHFGVGRDLRALACRFSNEETET